LNKIVTFLYKRSLRNVLEVWFLNNDDKAIFIKLKIVNENKSFILNGEGVNTNYFISSKKTEKTDKFVFLFLSRLVKEKGVEEFALAAEIVKQKYPDVVCQILGKTDIQNPNNVPVEKVEEWHTKGYIEHFEDSLDVRPYIANSDCVVLPSYYREGIPRCLMEAMSMERPIITTNNVGCVELLENNVNGIMCEKNDVFDLADKMEKMYLLDKNIRNNYGANGRKKILDVFDEKIIIKVYLDKMNSFMNGDYVNKHIDCSL
jgi:glycosyltransferase involved in cell wall biosynthesis